MIARVTRAATCLLDRWAREPALLTGPVLVRFKKRHHTGAGTFNVGEVASFPAHYAGQLVAAKIAKRVRPDAVSQVTPREDPEPEHDDSVDREMADALRREGVWMPPSTAIDLETPRWR